MTNLTKDNFTTEVEEHKGLVIIDLYADWCAPCKMIAPSFEELSNEIEGVKFCKINIDREPELAEMFRVQSIPMIAAVKDNTFLDMIIGYVEKDKICSFINEYK